MSRIIQPGEVGSIVEPRLTVDGLRNLIADYRAQGRVPKALVLSEYDRREVNQDLLAGSAEPVSKEDQKPEHDGLALGVIEGVVIGWNRNVGRGKVVPIFGPVIAGPQPEGKIIVGGPLPA